MKSYGLWQEGMDAELEKIFNKFGEEINAKLKEATDNILSNFIYDYLPFAESDLVSNMRNKMTDLLTHDYPDEYHKYEAKRLRELIFKEHREAIIEHLNQDNLEEIEKLKEQIKWLQEWRKF